MTALAGRKVLLTQPRNLAYEKHVFKFYQGILEYIKVTNEKNTTLYEDTILL